VLVYVRVLFDCFFVGTSSNKIFIFRQKIPMAVVLFMIIIFL
jgi:hypothetical protein